MFQHETSCIICLVDYEPNDMVTQLHCDVRHYFHTKCVEDWIKQGNNRCPYCRASIMQFGNNEDGISSNESEPNRRRQ